jgi:hypothetical protein
MASRLPEGPSLSFSVASPHAARGARGAHGVIVRQVVLFALMEHLVGGLTAGSVK